MSKDEKCQVCGTTIPESWRLCSFCAQQRSSRGDRDNPYYNGEGYADPTAYEALKDETSAATEAEVVFLYRMFNLIAAAAGFDILNRVELRERRTGRLFR